MSHDVLLFLTVFLACAVEAVEAVTIVLAVGMTRDWRSALDRRRRGAAGAGGDRRGPRPGADGAADRRAAPGGRRAAARVRAAVAAQGDPARRAGSRPCTTRRRSSPRRSPAARAAGRDPGGIDGYGFTVCFKGVLLEGLEVAFIVVTLGGNQQQRAACRGRRRGGVRGRRGGGVASRTAAEPRARERAEVRRRRDADLVRHVLGRRGRRRELAGRATRRSPR